jgi:hypothetical protein
MEPKMRTTLSSLAIGAMLLPSVATKAEIVNVFVTPEEALVATIHAEGAQVYECKADSSGRLSWKFREPIATLMLDGKTVGRHFAGPSWELSDGSLVTGKVSGSAPGATASDIPHLRLEIASQRGAGQLSRVTTIHRLNTKGGLVQGACEKAGTFLNAPYSADYLFYKRAGDAT